MFELRINTGTAAFSESPAKELGAILRRVADDASEHGLDIAESVEGPVRDSDGKAIGNWKYARE